MHRAVARHLRRNAVAYLALFVALGGTSYAALKLPKNSVGGKQIKKNAVTGRKVKNGSLKAGDFAAGTLLKGDKGAPGDPGPFPGVLPRGKTVRGTFAVTDTMPASDGDIMTGISFGFTLASAPAAHYIVLGHSVPSGCSGTPASPGAAPGNLCVFEANAAPFTAGAAVFDPTAGAVTANTSSRFGAAVKADSGGSGEAIRVRGSWAVTSP